MSKGSQHVVPHGSGWAVKSARGGRGVLVYETKREAIDAAQRIARRDGVELVIHGTEGQIFHSPAVPSRLSEDTVRAGIREVIGQQKVVASARLVADVIRGKRVGEALAILRFINKRAADPIEKCLRSAIANATETAERQNVAVDPDDLVVKTCYVDMGPTKHRRRVRPAPQGRAYREQRHFCHVTVMVSDVSEKGAATSKAGEAGRKAGARAGKSAQAKTSAKKGPAKKSSGKKAAAKKSAKKRMGAERIS